MAEPVKKSSATGKRDASENEENQETQPRGSARARTDLAQDRASFPADDDETKLALIILHNYDFGVWYRECLAMHLDALPV